MNKYKNISIFFYLQVDDKKIDKEKLLNNFIKMTLSILNNNKSWSCIGINFLQSNSKKKSDCIIGLVDVKTIKCECGFSNLSCAILNENRIWINYDRWMYGSKESKMNINDYRIYLINHETGHAIFNLKHPDKNEIYMKKNLDKKMPVMWQQTLSILQGYKPNPYPLIDEISSAYINFKKKYK